MSHACCRVDSTEQPWACTRTELCPLAVRLEVSTLEFTGAYWRLLCCCEVTQGLRRRGSCRERCCVTAPCRVWKIHALVHACLGDLCCLQTTMGSVPKVLCTATSFITGVPGENQALPAGVSLRAMPCARYRVRGTRGIQRPIGLIPGVNTMSCVGDAWRLPGRDAPAGWARLLGGATVFHKPGLLGSPAACDCSPSLC